MVLERLHVVPSSFEGSVGSLQQTLEEHTVATSGNAMIAHLDAVATRLYEDTYEEPFALSQLGFVPLVFESTDYFCAYNGSDSETGRHRVLRRVSKTDPYALKAYMFTRAGKMVTWQERIEIFVSQKPSEEQSSISYQQEPTSARPWYESNPSVDIVNTKETMQFVQEVSAIRFLQLL